MCSLDGFVGITTNFVSPDGVTWTIKDGLVTAVSH
jgi:hypothetical protein